MPLTLQELETIRSEVKRPDDFDAFWARERERVDHVSPEWERIEDHALSTPERPVEWLRMLSVDNRWVYGWLASGRRIPGERSAALLYLPGYSYGNPPPSRDMLYDGVITFCLNLHGNTPDTPYRHPRALGDEYITRGIESPQTYIYRDIVANCLCALNMLASLPDADPERIAVGGMSQGGGLALVCAAQSTVPKMCLADMPWLCNLDLALSLIDPDRYKPGKPVPDSRAYIRDYAEAHPDLSEQIYNTYRYFDPLSHAGSIRIPAQVSAGGRDPSCRPQTIFSVYNEIISEKEAIYLPETGHEVVIQMREAHARWILERFS